MLIFHNHLFRVLTVDKSTTTDSPAHLPKIISEEISPISFSPSSNNAQNLASSTNINNVNPTRVQKSSVEESKQTNVN